jgi:hypothetical protein
LLIIRGNALAQRAHWVLFLDIGGEKMEMPGSVGRLLSEMGLEKRRTVTELILTSIGIFSAGVLVGGALGVLFAPKSGRELRHDISDKLHHAAKEMKNGAEELRPT